MNQPKWIPRKTWLLSRRLQIQEDSDFRIVSLHQPHMKYLFQMIFTSLAYVVDSKRGFGNKYIFKLILVTCGTAYFIISNMFSKYFQLALRKLVSCYRTCPFQNLRNTLDCQLVISWFFRILCRNRMNSKHRAFL